MYLVAQKIKWLGHIKRIEDVNLVKRITDTNNIGLRTKGQTKNRERNEAINGVKKLKLRK